MTAADRIDRRFAKLLVANHDGVISHLPRGILVSLFRPGDLVVANDAATLPASLQGVHRPTGEPIEARLAAWLSLRDPTRFVAVVFGAGDYRMTTEDRAPPAPLAAGDRLEFGSLIASVEGSLNHPRLIHIRFAGSPASVMRDLVQHGRPIQYAHIPEPLRLWDVWTKIAADPIAFEGAIGGIWRSTGEPSRAGGSGALVSRPSRMRLVCRRQATPPSTGGFPSKNTIAFRRRARRRSRPPSRGQGASSRLGRASSGRSNPPPAPTEPCVRERAGQADVSLAARRSVLWMRSSRASINPVKVITSYSGRSPTTKFSSVCVLPLRSETIAPMSWRLVADRAPSRLSRRHVETQRWPISLQVSIGNARLSTVADGLWLIFSGPVTFPHHHGEPSAFIFARKYAAGGGATRRT